MGDLHSSSSLFSHSSIAFRALSAFDLLLRKVRGFVNREEVVDVFVSVMARESAVVGVGVLVGVGRCVVDVEAEESKEDTSERPIARRSLSFKGMFV